MKNEIGLYSVIYLVCICAALFSGQTIARTGRKEGTVKIAVSRSRRDALEFIQRESQLAGELLMQGYETEDDAHLAAAQRIVLDSSLKTQRVCHGAFINVIICFSIPIPS